MNQSCKITRQLFLGRVWIWKYIITAVLLSGSELIQHVFVACRFYFKKVSEEFDCGVVFEEVRDDDAILPIFEEKIIGKVEKVD